MHMVQKSVGTAEIPCPARAWKGSVLYLDFWTIRTMCGPYVRAPHRWLDTGSQGLCVVSQKNQVRVKSEHALLRVADLHVLASVLVSTLRFFLFLLWVLERTGATRLGRAFCV